MQRHQQSIPDDSKAEIQPETWKIWTLLSENQNLCYCKKMPILWQNFQFWMVPVRPVQDLSYYNGYTEEASDVPCIEIWNRFDGRDSLISKKGPGLVRSAAKCDLIGKERKWNQRTFLQASGARNLNLVQSFSPARELNEEIVYSARKVSRIFFPWDLMVQQTGHQSVLLQRVSANCRLHSA